MIPEEQENKKIVKIIQTTKGHIYSPHSCPDSTVKLTIFNEIFVPQCAKEKSNIPIDLQHLNFQKQNPFSLQNTSIAWASIQHQLRELLAKTNFSESEVLIFESSNYNEKLPQIFNRFQIVKGYNYRLKLESFDKVSEEKIALMNEVHVLKQIQMEFALGNGTFKPGYIGQINFEEIQSPIFQGIVKAYVNYASKTQCPIVLDFTPGTQETYSIVFQQNSKEIIENLSKKLQILKSFLIHAKQKNCSKNIIVYNLPIIFTTDKSDKNDIYYLNHFQKQIQTLINDFKITVGFKLLRYCKFNQKQGINQIFKLCLKYPSQVILSSGIKYKTDLTVFGGQGLSLYDYQSSLNSTNVIHMNSIEYMRHFLSEQILDQVLRKNILELFDWKEKKEEIQVEIFWKCDTCQDDFSEKIKAFGKFGKQFCSIKCLKACKF